MDVETAEEVDGIRMTFNAVAPTAEIAKQAAAPLACVYKPLMRKNDLAIAQYEPVTCSNPQCKAVLNPYSQIDVRTGTWKCALCGVITTLPPGYMHVSDDNLPTECRPQNTTMEYVLHANTAADVTRSSGVNATSGSFPATTDGDATNGAHSANSTTTTTHISHTVPSDGTARKAPSAPPSSPLLFLYVVDTCMEESELVALKDSLLVSLSLLPAYAQVGLITFGRHVYIHHMSSNVECSQMLVLKGDRDYLPDDIHQKLGFGSINQPGYSTAGTGSGYPGRTAPDPNTVHSATAPANAPSTRNYGRSYTHAQTSAKYLMPLEEIEFEFTEKLEQLLETSFANTHDTRFERATGTAMNAAVSLLEAVTCRIPKAAQIMLFTSGPCTFGPRAGGGGGVVVGPQLKQPPRSHSDIETASTAAKYYEPACQFYKSIADRAARGNLCINIFGACYDQIGYAEMQSMTDRTGGVVVLTDSFATTIFKQSFIRTFSVDGAGQLELGADAVLCVKTSPGLKLCGYLGQGISMHRDSKDVVTDKEYNDPFNLGHSIITSGASTTSNSAWSTITSSKVGAMAGGASNTGSSDGRTCAWRISGMRANTTVTIFLHPISTVGTPASAIKPPSSHNVIQFSTHYIHPTGDIRLRVTTVRRPRVSSAAELGPYIDQEAMAVVLARITANQLSQGVDAADVICWVDNVLIKLCKQFGQYTINQPRTFRLPPNLRYLPQFLYHLRRSPFLQTFNSSPDETAYYYHNLLVQDVTNSSIMIQPTLTAYDLDSQATPVLLDALSVQPERILLLDTFFHIVIFHGETISAWRRQGYAEDPQYANVKALLEAPRKDAADILVDRFPLPRFVDTEARGSQARFLMAKLNPSRGTGAGGRGGGSSGRSLVLTDDVALQDFMAVLMNITVAPAK